MMRSAYFLSFVLAGASSVVSSNSGASMSYSNAHSIPRVHSTDVETLPNLQERAAPMPLGNISLATHLPPNDVMFSV
jgi:hypothetical protein